MSANTELAVLTIYNRIVPKVEAASLTAKVEFVRRNDGSNYPSGIGITVNRGHLDLILSLVNRMEDEILDNYRWKYTDCRLGTIIGSDLDYNATDEEVIAFLEHTLATNASVIKR
jgi:hypothetical protein